MPVQVDRDSRKQIRLENTRRTILDAARKVFARDGIEAATMQDIAAEAGYGAPALYNYFPSKDEIVDVILSEVTARSLETLSRPLRDEEDFRAYFVSLIADLLRLAEEDRSVLSLVLSLGEAAGRTGELMRSHAARLTHRLEELLSTGMEQGALRLTSPETAARFVQAVARASLRMRQDDGRQPRREVLVEELGEFVFRGLSARR